ncbi:MAG: glycosyltransferase family 2 protein [Burkholderiaceae bacterium]|jgi:rhamnosyltransferase|nr:glycosyltransferase family 2 protein [Burkholderiaceae bacterium]
MKLGVLIVLFHPSDAELGRLQAVQRACDMLIVVDNTPAPDLRAQALATRDGFTLLHRGNVGGIAGAYNAGLEKLFPHVDAVALFDQDSTIPEAFFPTMRHICAELPEAFLAGPRIFEENGQFFLATVEMRTNGYVIWPFRVNPNVTVERCAFLISSGCVISREAFRVLGQFDEALFIDHVDVEYSLRAQALKVPRYLVSSLALPHRIGARQPHRFGPFTLMASNQSWLRRYYNTRNGVRLTLQYGLRFPFVILLFTWLQLRQIVEVALCERDKRGKFKSMLYGIVDGWLGRLGPIEKTRPCLAARANPQNPSNG